MAHTNRRYIGTFLPTDIHYSLITYASKVGKDPVEVAGELIQSALEREIEYQTGTLDEKDPRLELAHEYLHVRQQELARSQLVQIAQHVLQSSTTDEKMIEKLVMHCKANGFNYDDIMADAEQMSRVQASSVFSLGEDTGDNKIALFLSDLFKVKSSWAVTDVEKKAQDIGINIASLRLVKRRMGVVSHRRGSCWYWELQSIAIPSPVKINL
jgi:hypothetical protein